jgi:hypothetical protein
MRTNAVALGQINKHARKNGEPSPPVNDRTITVKLPKQWADEIEADAKAKRMTRNAFMRAMIRGYFGSACRP